MEPNEFGGDSSVNRSTTEQDRTIVEDIPPEDYVIVHKTKKKT